MGTFPFVSGTVKFSFPLKGFSGGLSESFSASTKPLLAAHLVMFSRAWKPQCIL